MKDLFFSSIALFLGNFLFFLLSRGIEALLLYQNHFIDGIFYDIFIGWLLDLQWLFIGSILLSLFLFLKPFGRAITWYFALFFSALFHLFHIPILLFYINSLSLLDGLVLIHTFEEMADTVFTADINLALIVLLSAIYFALYFVIVSVIKKTHLIFKARKLLIWISAIFFVLAIIGGNFVRPSESYQGSNIRINKSIHFYSDVFRSLNKKHDRTGSNDVLHNTQVYQSYFSQSTYFDKTYPFFTKRPAGNPLGPFFRHSTKPPNLVFIVVEGLNNDFVHPNEDGLVFMPFLDSLKDVSLYWEHFLGTGERSYAVIPSMLGSLPHGSHGFTSHEDMPLHLNLLRLLKPKGYHTAFYYGQGGYFHKKVVFFKRNNVDLFVDKNNYDESFSKIYDASGEYFWGYNDKDLFANYFQQVEQVEDTSRLEIFFTGTMHSPYAVAEEEYYDSIFENRYLSEIKSERRKKYYNKYHKYVRTLVFTDDALRNFFSTYAMKPEFSHTIFIITGDHPMSEIYFDNPLKKYHVPLIIFSPLLNKSYAIQGVGSQFDVFPSVVSLLEDNYGMKGLGEYGHYVGFNLDTSQHFNAEVIVPFMKANRIINELVHNEYFLTGNHLYKLGKGFILEKIDNEDQLSIMSSMLDAYNKANADMANGAKLLPDSMFCKCSGMVPLLDTIFHEGLEIMPENLYVNISGSPIQHSYKEKYYVFVRGQLTKINEDKLPAFVMDVKSETGEVILWNSIELEPRKRYNGKGDSNDIFFNHYFVVNNEVFTDGKLSLKCYFWNLPKTTVNLQSLEVKIFADK